MAIFILDDEVRFPSPSLADKDGLIAVGGDLSADRLILAYTMGIFPWFNDNSPIMWWSPDPRMVLFPAEFKISKSFSRILKKGKYEVRFDHDFRAVIRHCASTSRRDEEGTWITPEIMAAYISLHKQGYAHSVETYLDGRLSGGLYGVSIGKAFFGESMFYIERDASKVALAALVDRLMEWDFHFIDAQQRTEHLRSLGARPIPRKLFLELLKNAVEHESVTGKW